MVASPSFFLSCVIFSFSCVFLFVSEWFHLYYDDCNSPCLVTVQCYQRNTCLSYSTRLKSCSLLMFCSWMLAVVVLLVHISLAISDLTWFILWFLLTIGVVRPENDQRSPIPLHILTHTATNTQIPLFTGLPLWLPNNMSHQCTDRVMN